MFPYIIQSDRFTIGSYGLMLAIAYLVGRWYFLKQLIDRNSLSKNSEILIIMLLVSGVLGAKILFLIKHPDKSHLMFSGEGFSSQGALLGALLATYFYTLYDKTKLHVILDSAAPAAILAYAIARIGCFLSGDDCYGIPTDLPWAMSFPHGIKATDELVHPVPLYEMGYSLVIFVLLLARKRKVNRPYDQLFTLAGLWGICRFLVEFVSTNEKVIFSMSSSQFGALLMFAASGIYFMRQRGKKDSR
ncbi:MAG: prolipoprotein diacylglyceryl transferase [Kangiellaceae bacterium]|nr:prolipoprotein diacylglyceryl transferase [Kangiellaceae bacterium]